MSSAPAPQTSGSEEDAHLIKDERKRKRMLSNRESARRSRMRKQQHLDDLVNQVALLKEENSQISMQINLFTQQYVRLEPENTVLRTQVMELTDRLQSLNSLLHFMEELSGMSLDIPEMPDPFLKLSGMSMDIPEMLDPFLKPWQLPCPAQPIMALAEMFQC